MARPSRSAARRPAIVVAVVAVALVAGVFLVRLTRASSSGTYRDGTAASAAAPGTTAANGELGPARDAAGTPAPLAHDEAGAVAAAVAYATAAQRWLYLSDAEIEAAIADIATPVAATRLTDDAVADVSTAREQLARAHGPVWWLVRPLAWRVDHFADREARVSVWTVTILSAAGVAAPQVEFLTVTLDLAWVDGAWRVDGVRDTPGPTPITGPQDQPWDAEPFAAALNGFTRIDAGPVS